MKKVHFCFQQKVQQGVTAHVMVPDGLISDDAIIDFICDNPGEWKDEHVVDEDIVDCDYASVELEQ